MLRKGIDDIRTLRSTDPRIQTQMSDLSRWRPVSTLPAVRRDISIVITADQDDETIGDTIRDSLADRIDDIETVTVVARTPHEVLPVAARDRLGTQPGQVNALVRSSSDHSAARSPTRKLTNSAIRSTSLCTKAQFSNSSHRERRARRTEHQLRIPGNSKHDVPTGISVLVGIRLTGWSYTGPTGISVVAVWC